MNEGEGRLPLVVTGKKQINQCLWFRGAGRAIGLVRLGGKVLGAKVEGQTRSRMKCESENSDK